MNSDALKKQGNDAFAKKEYSKAITLYSDALSIDPENPTLYSNRSGSYCALGKYEQAASDAKTAILKKPDWVKGYTRLGAALTGEQDWESAAQAYRKAIELDPSNQDIKGDLTNVLRNQAIEDTQDEITSTSISHLFTEQNLNRIAKYNSQFSKLLQEDEIKTIINQVRQDTKNLGQFYSNSKFKQILNAILTGDVQSTSSFSAKEDAEEEKNKGNIEFKNGRLEEALIHYNKAIEFDEFNITYYNNKATVLNKQGKYEEAIQVCELAIKKSKQCNAPFETIAKTYQKVASAQNSMGNIELAIEALKSSLFEKKDPQVQKELRNLESLLKKKKLLEYQNPELAEKAKDEGNSFYKNNEFVKAIDCYNEAIKRGPKNPVYYSNRAAAYLKLNDIQKAMNDCNKAIDLDPNFAKAYTRKGSIHMINKEYFRARECFKKAMEIDPKNEEAINGIKKISDITNSNRDKEPDEEQIRRHMADPEIQKILNDPKMKKILARCQKDPNLFREYYKDPEVAENFKKLQVAGILH